jgi:hypothetical protein
MKYQHATPKWNNVTITLLLVTGSFSPAYAQSALPVIIEVDLEELRAVLGRCRRPNETRQCGHAKQRFWQSLHAECVGSRCCVRERKRGTWYIRQPHPIFQLSAGAGTRPKHRGYQPEWRPGDRGAGNLASRWHSGRDVDEHRTGCGPCPARFS